MAPLELPWGDSLPIALLQPSEVLDGKSVSGIVTLIWPYSASRKSLSLLLVEPDFRLRRKQGQVKVHFIGSSAKVFARSGVKSGDRILLSLGGVRWIAEKSTEKTPGKGIAWELQYVEQLRLQLQRDGEDAVLLDVDHPADSPQSHASPPTPLQSPDSPGFVVPAKRVHPLIETPQAWVSPAFLKRKVSSAAPVLNSIYDPFEYRDDFAETTPSKRTKFGRKCGEWRFADRSPSPAVRAEADIEEDDGVPHEIAPERTAVDELTNNEPEMQSGNLPMPDKEAADAVVPSIATPVNHVESLNGRLSTNTPSIDEIGHYSNSKDTSSQTSSAYGTGNEEQSSERRIIVQDTYEPEIWSTSSLVEDPNMEGAEGVLYGENHQVINKAVREEQAPVSSPPQHLSSPHSRPMGSMSNYTESSDHELASQVSHLSPERIESVGNGEELFSKRAYEASVGSRDFDMSSEDDEPSDSISDGSFEGKDQHDLKYDTPQASLSPTGFMPSSPQTFDQGYDGSVFSRPRSRSLFSQHPGDQNGDLATSLELNEPRSDVPALPGDSEKESTSESRIELGGTLHTPHHDTFHVSSAANVRLEPHDGVAVLREPNGKSLPYDQQSEPTHEISGTADMDEAAQVLARRYADDIPVDDSFDQREQRSAPTGDREGDVTDFEEARHEVLQSYNEGLNGSREKALKSDESGVGQHADLGHPTEVETSDNNDDIDDSQEEDGHDDEGNHLVRMARSVSDPASRPIEVIDVDEYEPVGSPNEDMDGLESEEGDYWSDEELQHEDELEFGSTEGSNFGGEGELESDVGVSGEEDMEHENSALNTGIAESGQDQIFTLGPKTPEVEIIDLESDEEHEPSIASAITDSVPQISSDAPDLGNMTTEDAALAQSQKERFESNDLTQPWQPQHREGGIDEATLDEQDHSREEAPWVPRDEVPDTYSEDDSQSDTANSETMTTIQGMGQPNPMQWLPEQVSGSAALDRTPGASVESSAAPDERHTKEDGSRALTIAEDDSERPSELSPQREANALPEEATEEKSAYSPIANDRPPSVPPISPTGKPSDQLSVTSDPRDARSALDEISIQQDEPTPVQDGTELSEQETREYSLVELREELTQRSQLPTPTDTQTTKVMRELSNLSQTSEDEQDTLLTPSLTQRTSDLLQPTPPLPRKPSLVERLKEMRSDSARRRQSNLGKEHTTALSPWFGTSKSSDFMPSSDQEPVGVEEDTGRDGDISSEAEQSELDREPLLSRHRNLSPVLPSVFARLPSSSPPPRPEPDSGFRTSLSYFASLSTLRSHYNSATSVLALVVGTTPIARAASGPRDYHMTLYVTDPTSSSSPSVTSAQIFRSSKFPFPEARQGDAILLRNFRVVSYKKRLGLLSTDSSAWAVFRRGEEPQIRGPPVEFGAEERAFARGHWDWWGTVKKERYIEAVPSDNVESPKRNRETQRGKGRSSIVRHELRDGTTYVDRPKVENTDMHELRDGTQWSDSKP